MKLGTNDIGSVYLGTNAVQKVYLGTNEVWSAFDPTIPAQEFYDRVTAAGGSLTTTEEDAILTLISDLASYGIWDKMKAIYPMVGASAAACAQNLKSASFTGTFTSGWTFASTGATPNGTSAFMDTGLNGTNLTNNNHSQSFYSRSNIDSGGFQIGAANNVSFGIVTGFRIKNAGDANAFSQMTTFSPFLTVANSTSAGLFTWSRTQNNLARAFMNTSTIGSLNDSATGNINNLIRNFYVGALNIGSVSGSQFSSNECAFASIGDGLTDTQASNFYTAVQAFQTTLGRQV